MYLQYLNNLNKLIKNFIGIKKRIYENIFVFHLVL